jgi:hypothetical protein
MELVAMPTTEKPNMNGAAVLDLLLVRKRPPYRLGDTERR